MTAKSAAPRPELAQRILQAAKPLFAQHGYGGVSIDRIADAAGISKQNLLYYFAKQGSCCTARCWATCWTCGCRTWTP